LAKTAVTRGILITAILSVFSVQSAAEDGAIDASDPTKVYTYAGGGLKYTDYTNDDQMYEVRATGNWGVTSSDMVLFEFGYGWHQGDISRGTQDENDLTNARIRYFHLFPMDYSVARGYRGMAAQVDLQLAGNLIGTDGQNMVTFGALPAYGLSERWSFYLPINLPLSWDKKFEKFNGTGIGVAPLLVYTPDWWPGSYVQIWPAYNYFFQGELSDVGSGNFDVTLGGSITERIVWSITGQKQLDEDLGSFRRGRDTGVQNDWNVFANVSMYF
jgi:hypothetical protein